MGKMEPGLAPILVTLGGGVFCLWIGALFLFRAKALRDQTLRSYEGREGWFPSLNRWFLASPGYVMSFRVGGVLAMLVGVLMLWVLGSNLAAGA